MAVILQVAVPSPLRRSFDYLLGSSDDPQSVQAGMRVEIPFGRQKKIVGLILNITDHSDFPIAQLKQIHRIIDSESILNSSDLELITWASRYYQHPIGDAIFSSLPKLIRQGRELGQESKPSFIVCADTLEHTDLSRSPRQAALIERLRQYEKPITQEELRSWPEYTSTALKQLLTKGLIHAKEEVPEVDDEIVSIKKALPLATEEQQHAIDVLKQKTNEFHCTVLNGITGSGKTYVYMQTMASILKENQQVLILLPEIGLTPQAVQRFAETFSGEVSVYHSGLTDLHRFRVWQQVRENTVKIIIGTRSAIWLPFTNLGLIVIDEEHDQSYKQQEGFRYSARDIAVYRAQKFNIPIILGSATPSMETRYNIEQQRYDEIRLQHRIGESVLPELAVIDMKAHPKEGAFSEPLINEIKRVLTEQQQVLLFINQRGFAPVMLCDNCGAVAYCDRCDKPMTYHRLRGVIWCHHCDRQIPLTSHCPQCNHQQWIEIGHGTERVEEEIAALFPSARLQRVDRDTTRTKGSLNDYLDKMHSGETDILVGTQMLAKGHDFPNLSLVGILDIDNGLYSTDFRASERLAQLITQVSGRAGRAEIPGKVVLQTYQPQHPLLTTLIQDGYDAFTQQLLKDRSAAGLPPYSYQALVRAEAIRSDRVQVFLNKARAVFPNTQGIDIFGPIIAPMAKKAGKHRMQLLIEARQRRGFSETLTAWLSKIEALPEAGKVRWTLDVDPQDMS